MWRSVLSFGALGAVAMALSAQASAQPADTWSGFSVSIGGGGAKTDTDLNVDTRNTDRLAFPGFFGFFPGIYSLDGQATGHAGLKDDGWHGFGTLQAGYDQRIGNFVVGVFGDFDFYPDKPKESSTSGIDGSVTAHFDPFGPIPAFPISPAFPVANYASVSSSVELDNTWSVGGRLGYLVTPGVLIYGLGGYTQARLDGQVSLAYADAITGAARTLSLSLPDELRGYIVGGGGEYKVTRNIALRLEYRYANYSGKTDSASASFAAGPPFFRYTQNANVQASLDEQIQTVRAALVLKLGQP